MARPVLLFAAAGAFAVLVAGYGAFAWIEAEDRVLAAAAAEGRAVLDAVAAGVRSSVDASAAVDAVLSQRLFDLASQLDAELADEAGDLEAPLQAFVTAHGLRGAIVLDRTMAVRAAASARRGPARNADGAFDEARLARAEAERIAADARPRWLEKTKGVTRITFGFGESPFSARPEYLVGDLAPRLEGFVLLRQDASDLNAYEERAGVAKLLAAAAKGPGVAYLVVQSKDRRILAANDPARVGTEMPHESKPAWRNSGGARVLDVSLPLGAERLRVGLAAAPVEETIAEAREYVIAFVVVALVADAAVLAFLLQRSRRLDQAAERERFQAMGRLAAGVAHEIRSPLNALSMAAQRLQREAVPSEEPQKAKFAELTSALRGGIARLDGTIREFLALGQGGPPPETAPIDIAKLVAEVVAAEGVEVRIDAPAAAVTVRGDRALLAKALGNLVRNAHQIAPGTVRVAWHAVGADALIEVIDRGPGIDPDDRARVFEPFFTKRPGGTGLGLAIAKDAIERQGGRISVTGAGDGGARFAIRLPAEGM